MRFMRALAGIIGLAFALGGMAQAADLPRAPAVEFYSPGWLSGQRAGVLVIYDDQPGVVVRDYWRAPWQQRHYYPATGRRPRIGRRENLSARRRVLPPAEDYWRFWSNASALPSELAPVRERYPEARRWTPPEPARK